MDDNYEAKKEYYETKKERKIEIYKDRAQKAEKESNQKFEAAHNLIKDIPMGQPILTDHYSAKNHLSNLRRHDGAMRKAFEEQEKAAYYFEKVIAAESNNSISSDDPDAIEKLKEKIIKLVAKQEFMKKVNKEYKKMIDAKLKNIVYEMQLTDDEFKIVIKEINEMSAYENQPYPKYALQNNNACIRVAKNRIALLEKAELKNPESTIYTIEGIPNIAFKKDVIENRFKIYPPSKDESFKIGLPMIFKKFGFRWSPTNKCYQRFLATMNKYVENAIIEALKNVMK